MKIFFRRIHLYLAFAAGLVIMTTCFTGAVLVFEEDIQHTFHKERYFVPRGEVARPVEDMVSSLLKKAPGVTINGIKIYSDSSRSTEIFYTIPKEETGKKKDKPGTIRGQGLKVKPGQNENIRFTAYINPYTADVIELFNYRDTFFYSMMALHRWLLGGDTGKLIVGTCTLIFLFILFTGIILWWPKTSSILRQRIKIKWDSGWKRLNHDLHIVLGFYSAIFLFIFAFTGLAWSFSWFNNGIYKITGSSMEQQKTPVSPHHSGSILLSYDEVLDFLKTTVTDGKFYIISAPKDSLAPYTVNVLPYGAPHESAGDVYFIDRYKPLVLQSRRFTDRNLGQKVRSVFKPIHTAAIWGTPSKIIGLIVCILGVIFPLTGYLMWWLRWGKSKKAGYP
ncbi:MAG: PepSY domain-containing protein [Ferruginibacter sp.]|nr:PepSY domain-containing protein [Ferruginibacter sp.]